MLQKQPLLRIHELCVNRRYIEKQGIKFIHPSYKSPPFAVMLSAPAAILAVIPPPVPPLLRHLDDAVLPRSQILPIGLYIHRFRIAAAQSDNGYRFSLPRSARPGTTKTPKT